MRDPTTAKPAPQQRKIAPAVEHQGGINNGAQQRRILRVSPKNNSCGNIAGAIPFFPGRYAPKNLWQIRLPAPLLTPRLAPLFTGLNSGVGRAKNAAQDALQNARPSHGSAAGQGWPTYSLRAASSMNAQLLPCRVMPPLRCRASTCAPPILSGQPTRTGNTRSFRVGKLRQQFFVSLCRAFLVAHVA